MTIDCRLPDVTALPWSELIDPDSALGHALTAREEPDESTSVFANYVNEEKR